MGLTEFEAHLSDSFIRIVDPRKAKDKKLNLIHKLTIGSYFCMVLALGLDVLMILVYII